MALPASLAVVGRHRKALLQPVLPRRCLARDYCGRLIAIQIEVHPHHALTAGHAGDAQGPHASEAGLSCSALADRFVALIGEPRMQ